MLAAPARGQREPRRASRSAPTAHAWRAAIALHLPLELAALSLAGGAYMSGKPTTTAPARALALVAALCALLLALAATLETYAPLGGVR